MMVISRRLHLWVPALAAGLCVLLFGGGPGAGAQQPPALRADIVSLTEAGYPLVSVVVSVDDTSGGGLSGLTAANFGVTVAGKAASVSKAELASSEDVPLDLVLVIDTSGSMAGEPIAQALAAAKQFVHSLSPNDRVAVIAFADEVVVAQEFTADRGLIDAAIDHLEAKGNTALYGATTAAAFKAASSPSSRRAIVLLSDGAQEGVTTQVTREQAIAAAVTAGGPVFAVGEGTSIDKAYLSQLADATKGRYLEAPSPSDLNALYASVGRLLHSQYIVTFDASAAAGAPEAAVAVTLNAGGQSATATATFRPSASFVAPVATVTGLQAGESLSEPRQVTVTVSGGAAVGRVAFYVDDVNVFETAAAPYVFTYLPASFGPGEHSLRVAVATGAKAIDAPPIRFTSTPPAASTGGRGDGLPLVPVAAAGAGVLVVAAMLLVLLRLGRRGGDASVVPSDQRITPWRAQHRMVSTPPPERDEEAEAPAAEEAGEPLGLLIVRQGPEFGGEWVVGDKPVSIGSGVRCAVRLNDPALAAEEARVWVRNGHLMVHRMTRLTAIAAEGVSGGWAILEPGDVLELGDRRFEFGLIDPGAAAARARAVPDILRDPDIPPRAGAEPASPPIDVRRQGPANLPQPGGMRLDADEEAS